MYWHKFEALAQKMKGTKTHDLLKEDDHNDGDGVVVVKNRSPQSRTLCCIITVMIVLIIVLIAMTAAVIGLAVSLGVERSKSSSSSTNVCLDEGCIQASAQLLASMNQSVDPCVDFYQFTCGNWLNSRILPVGTGLYSAVQNIPAENTRVTLQKIFERGEDGGVEAVNKSIIFFQSCIDTETIENLGTTPLLELIIGTGGWSLIGVPEAAPQWNINGIQFFEEIFNGSDAFFNIDVNIDLQNSSRNVLILSQSGIQLQADAYADVNATNELKGIMTTILSHLNDTGDYDDAVEQVINFEANLSSIFVPNAENLIEMYNRFTIEDLSTMWGDFNWQKYFESFFNIGATSSNMDISGMDIIITSPEYFRSLSSVFQATSTDVLKNYARWHFIKGYFPYLSAEMSNQQLTQERVQRCISEAQAAFPIAIARPFTEEAVPKGTKMTISIMIDYIKAAFKERLNRIQWLDDVSRTRCLRKVEKITRMVAYPERIFDNDYVNGLYTEYNIRPNDYFGNYRRMFQPKRHTVVQMLRDGVDKTQWPVAVGNPTDINAFYHASLNQFIFLEGILHAPVFNADWPDYITFGAFGSIIGHELTHGFDNQGQRFDEDGNLRQWWTNASISEFEERQKCFVKQYNNFFNKGFRVNGTFTLGENIADNGGINAAYQAYLDRVKELGTTQPSLPSLPYSPDQLFFIAFGQLWCTLYDSDTAKELISTDSHSPGRARNMAPVMNSFDFPKVFNCPVGSPMNPPEEQKCVLW